MPTPDPEAVRARRAAAARAGRPATRELDGAFVFVGRLNHTETPRSRAVEHRTEDHHPAGVDERLPIGSVATHDRPLLVGHVERERRARSNKFEHESAHRPAV